MHDRPLRSSFAPAALGFFRRQAHHSGDAEIAVEFSFHDEDAAPDHMAWFGNAFDCAAAQSKIHRRLAFAASALPTADEMRGRGGARNQKDPDVIIHSVSFVVLPPA